MLRSSAVSLVLLCCPALAQSGAGYDLRRNVIAGGGTFSMATGLTAGGTIGQADAGILSGSRYTVIGGFWGVIVLPATATLTPTNTATATNTVTATITATRTPTFTATFTRINTATLTATASNTPTKTPTPTFTAIGTATRTPTETVTPTGTPTGAPPLPCTGDCDGNSQVTVDELITLANIALGHALRSACRNGVSTGDGIHIAVIVEAVNNALKGCGR